jgi:hypothetical protein
MSDVRGIGPSVLSLSADLASLQRLTTTMVLKIRAGEQIDPQLGTDFLLTLGKIKDSAPQLVNLPGLSASGTPAMCRKGFKTA